MEFTSWGWELRDLTWLFLLGWGFVGLFCVWSLLKPVFRAFKLALNYSVKSFYLGIDVGNLRLDKQQTPRVSYQGLSNPIQTARTDARSALSLCRFQYSKGALRSYLAMALNCCLIQNNRKVSRCCMRISSLKTLNWSWLAENLSFVWISIIWLWIWE